MSDFKIKISEARFGKAERDAVEKVLRSGRLAQGPRVQEFEERFADHVGAYHGVACGNGTQALHLALLAKGVGPGDLVVVPTFSFGATANAVLMCGARVVFVDVDPTTACIDPRSLFRLGASVVWIKAIIPVHLYGYPVVPLSLSSKPWVDAGLPAPAVVADACQAHGAAWRTSASSPWLTVGSYETSCWSFYATKNLPIGEGGMVTTHSRLEAQKLRGLRSHHMCFGYDYAGLGYNYRMTEMQAAIGLEQLRKLPEMQERRTANAAYYEEKLRDVPGIVRPYAGPNVRHAWHQYTVRVEDGPEARGRLLDVLAENGIEAKVYYPIPLHRTGLYGYRGHGTLKLRSAEHLADRVLSIPVHPHLKKADRAAVVRAIKAWAREEERTWS